jgi:hypothetical protein
VAGFCEHGNEPSGSIKGGIILPCEGFSSSQVYCSINLQRALRIEGVLVAKVSPLPEYRSLKALDEEWR